jgi:hypothetical protein
MPVTFDSAADLAAVLRRAAAGPDRLDEGAGFPVQAGSGASG